MVASQLKRVLRGKNIEMSAELRDYEPEECLSHNKEGDCWLIIGNSTNGGPKVYDVSKYIHSHPGGADVMLENAGKNVDGMFEDISHSRSAKDEMAKYLIGTCSKSVVEVSKDAAGKISGGGLSPAVLIVFIVVAILGFLLQRGDLDQFLK